MWAAFTRVIGLLAIVCALSLLPGCSWAYVERAPPEHARYGTFNCTTSSVLPVADTVLAAGFGVVGGAIVYDGAGCDPSDHPILGCAFEKAQMIGGALLLVPAVLLAASAITGFVATAECDAALAAPPREYVAPAPQAPVVPAPPPPPDPAPRRGANGTLDYTFKMSDVRVDLRASVDDTDRVQVGLSRIVPADRSNTTPCDTWSIVAGAARTSVPGGLYRTTQEAAGIRETFANDVPMSALRSVVDGSGQGFGAIELCGERIYLPLAARNELARFFEELDAMVRERAPSETPPPIALVEAAQVTTP
jgi:hypothetical protein